MEGIKNRDKVAKLLTKAQIIEANMLAWDKLSEK